MQRRPRLGRLPVPNIAKQSAPLPDIRDEGDAGFDLTSRASRRLPEPATVRALQVVAAFAPVISGPRSMPSQAAKTSPVESGTFGIDQQ
jgi:hypothetical protein